MIRLQSQSQSLLNAMVLASLTTFHTATIDGIRVWKEYNNGEAGFIKWSEFNLPRKISTSQIMKVTEDNISHNIHKDESERTSRRTFKQKGSSRKS